MPLSDQEKTISALKIAIQMEIDGKSFYLKSAEVSSHKAGERFFIQLAEEEDSHRKTFESIYEALRKKYSWPDITISPFANIKTFFAQVTPATEKSTQPDQREIDSVKMAINMEVNSRDYYQEQSEIAKFNSEKAFYIALAGQENGHYLLLLDYLEFLHDPAGYYSRTEHHSLDG